MKKYACIGIIATLCICILMIGYKAFQYRQTVISLNFQVTNLSNENASLSNKNSTLNDNSELLLKKLIESECKLDGKNDYEKVNSLRQWVHRNVYWGGYSSKNPPITSLKTSEMFIKFHNKELSVMCGGTAYALQRVYKLFGYETYTIDSGIVGTMTHVITIVKINYNLKEIYSIQDATFNITYTANENPIDYIDMITKLKQLHYKDITMSSLTSNYNEGIPTYTKFSNSCKSKLYKCFKLDNYPSNLMYIFMYPLNSDNKDFLNTIKAIINT